MHRERAGTFEPQLIPRALEERQERVTVAGRAMAKVRSFRQRAGSPGELATRAQQTPMLVVVGGTIPKEDSDELKQRGVAEVFTPGVPTTEIVDFLKGKVPV